MAALVVYAVAGVLTAMIGWKSPGAPADRTLRIAGVVVIGLLWPFFLFAHWRWDLKG